MKTTLRILLPAFITLMLISCKDRIEEFYTVNEPVYMTYNELRGDLKVTPGQDIIQPGKIYFKDDFIFVNEYMKGIHVIDNSDPHTPQIIRFIEIPGNVDMAIRENILYADSYVDLVAIDISNMNDIREVKRVTDAFPYIIPICEDGVVENIDESKGVITAWRPTEKKITDGFITGYGNYPEYVDREFFYLSNGSGVAADAGGGTVTGKGGSMARFTVYDDYLYAIDNYQLRIFHIAQSADPQPAGEIMVGWNIETIFPYDEKLFIGSTTGMYIFSLTTPSNPTYLSAFWHVNGCDPVVVEDTLAYVTLKAGNLCGNNLSQLDVISIADIMSPRLLKEYVMEEPYGLGIDDHILFVCDGEAGLKIYDATDPMSIDQNMIALYNNLNAWDVIPLGNVLIMTGADGLYQYDYSDLQDIRQISVIPIENLVHQLEK